MKDGETQSFPPSFISLLLTFLTGPIQEGIGSLKGLDGLDLSNNLLIGIIPDSISNLTLLTNMSVSTNLLSGNVPDSFLDLKLLSEMYIDSNFLTGTLPNSFLQLSELQVFFAANNHFTGSLPCAHEVNRKLAILNYSSNNFEGKVNNCFTKIERLQTLLLSDNRLTGNINFLVNTSVQPFIQTIDLSNNRLTGSLPGSLFNQTTKSLVSFAAVKNCFTGTIPPEICYSFRLEVIALDGLSSGCIEKALAFAHSESYFLPKNLEGTIPRCLYTMPSLKTLHLSGNGLSGSLPDDIELIAITDISLSHNMLTGTIPKQFQEREYSNFDLSFNRITGVISDNISDFQNLNGSLTLEINRLSGKIPSQLIDMSSINILKGNIFQCHTSLTGKTDVPENDPDSDSYSCSSVPVNNSLYLWLAIILITTLIPVLLIIYAMFRETNQAKNKKSIVYKVQKIYFNLRSWWLVFHNRQEAKFYDQELDHVYDFGMALHGIRMFCLYITIFICCILLPTHIALGSFYGSYTFEYAWLFSMGYLSGTTPAYILLVMLIFFVFFVRRILKQSEGLYLCIPEEEKERLFHYFSSWRNYWDYIKQYMNYKLFFSMIGLALLNCLGVLWIQAGYVIAVTSSLSYVSITLIALTLSGIMVVWNNIVVIGHFSKFIKAIQNEMYLPGLTDSIIVGKKSEINRRGGKKNYYDSNTDRNLFNEERRIFFLTHLLIFNNVLAPFLAALCITPDCFYYLLVTPPTVGASYTVIICDEEVGSYVIEGRCISRTEITQNLSYDPPFLYTYQCSSNLLPTFIAFYLYRYFFTAVALPLIRLGIKYFQEWYFFRYGPDKIFYLLCSSLLTPHRIISSPEDTTKEIQVIEKESSSTQIELSDVEQSEVHIETIHSEEFKTPPQISSSRYRKSTVDEVTKINQSFFEKRQFINRDYIVLPIISEFTVFFTFGTIFPPLAVVVCYAIFITTYFIQLTIGRVIVISRIQHGLKRYMLRVDEECRNFRRLFLQSIPSISILASFFWGFFLFDILGDEISNLSSLWILFVMGMTPIFIYLLEGLVNYCLNWNERSRRKKNDKGDDVRESEMELAPSSVTSPGIQEISGPEMVSPISPKDSFVEGERSISSTFSTVSGRTTINISKESDPKKRVTFSVINPMITSIHHPARADEETKEDGKKDRDSIAIPNDIEIFDRE